ncbi:MAG: L-lactate dehydrogenase [Syntrophorhabdaceae bacterium]
MKIGIVGTGFVGSAAAFAIVMKGVATEVVLVDKNAALARAQAADILHAVPFGHSVIVRSGYYPDLAGSSAVIIAAGRNRTTGESRLDLASDNTVVLREVVPSIIQYAPCAVLVVTTNPVDIMTHVATRIAGVIDVPASRIIGSGTVLDTARFRTLLGHFLDIDSKYVQADVVGEHGDSEVMAWSLARVGGLKIDEICVLLGKHLDEHGKETINDEVRHAGRDIIAGKGATYYGIGSVLAHIIDIIAHDHRAIVTVSTFMHDCEGVRDVTISRPHVIGGNGILASLPLPLDENERQALIISAQTLRRVIGDLGY